MPMTRFTRPSLTRYPAWYVAGALLLTAALLCPAGGGAQQKPLRPYTLILDFVPTGEYVPHYTALEKGYYRDEGLDVKILRGQGSGDTVKRIAAGQGEVGIADISALIAARANTDVAVKAIALWYRRPPHGVFVRGDSPIKTSKELEGKKLAISPGNSHQILWPVFEKLSGLKPGSVTWVTMDAASMPPALIRSAVDAVPFFVVHEARIRKIAKQQNADIRVLAAWADLGFDVASTSLVAREETIAKDPEGLKAFLRATLKGADYAFRQKHFDEGVGYVVKAHPEVDPDGAVGAAQVGARFVYASEVTSGKMAVGQFDPAQLEKTRDLYTQYLELKRKVGLEEIYTNDLLPAKK
jgi:NitT/TauT family transport system substrate-binding protein